MEAARWSRIQELFHQAAERPASEWRAFLTAAGAEPELVEDVLVMLEEDARGASLLDRGLAEVAGRVMGEASPPPRELGPYRITGVLGEGGMGAVYRAERSDVGSVVAIKFLRDAWLSPARRDRFAREQRLLAQLQHPSIARLHDAGALPDGTPWFVMELVDGVPLTEHCRARGLSIEARLRLFRQVCEAVQHAHRHLVIHRDLKPSNILVTADGNPKLLDFGISKQLDGPHRVDPGRDPTRTALRLMTPAYAAPEQIREGRAAVDTDVYSLGVVLYELLAGKLPFDLSERSPAEAERILLEEEPERPSAVAARSGERSSRSAWADLDVLVQKAMHKDRARRYPTVEALIRDIDHYLAGEPLEARPDDLRYRAGKFVGRNARPLAAAALGLLAVAALVVFYTVRLTSARNAAVAEAARTRRIQRFMLDIFEGGDREAGPAEGLLATTLVDRGLQEAHSLGNEPAVQAELYQTLGTVYDRLGNMERAEQLLVLALERRRATFGPRHPEVARSLTELALLRSDQARFDEAERLAREALDIDRQTLPAGDPGLPRALTVLGKVLEDRGQYEQAIPLVEEALRLHAAAHREDLEMGQSLTELANIHYYAGHLDRSRALNEQALALDRKLHGDRHPNVSSDLFNLGIIQADRGNYPEAERFDREGLAITEAWYGRDHPQWAYDATALARVLNLEGRPGEAAALFEHALEIQERVHGKVHPMVASILNDLGHIARDQDHLEAAEGRYQRALEIYRTLYAKKPHFLIGMELINLAQLRTLQKRPAEAETIARQALDIYKVTLEPGHLRAAVARAVLGRALLRQQRLTEAQTESQAAHDILVRVTQAGSPWLKKVNQDLLEEAEALHQPDRARQVQAELTAAAK